MIEFSFCPATVLYTMTNMIYILKKMSAIKGRRSIHKFPPNPFKPTSPVWPRPGLACEKTFGLKFFADDLFSLPYASQWRVRSEVRMIRRHIPQALDPKILCARFASTCRFQPRGCPGSACGGDSNSLMVHAVGSSVFLIASKWRGGSRFQSARWFVPTHYWFPGSDA